MDRCPANYSLLVWLPGDAASHISLVSAVKLFLPITADQFDREARGLPWPTHGWLSPNQTLRMPPTGFQGLGDGSLNSRTVPNVNSNSGLLKKFNSNSTHFGSMPIPNTWIGPAWKWNIILNYTGNCPQKGDSLSVFITQIHLEIEAC